MRVLHVMKGAPWPTNRGHEADIWSRLSCIAKLGHEVHVLISTRSPISEECLRATREIAAKVDVVGPAPVIRSVFTRRPTLIARNDTLAHVKLDHCYNVVIAEGEEVSSIFEHPDLRDTFRVLRVHNDESAYLWALVRSETRLPWKCFFGLDAFRYRFYLKPLYRTVDAAWFISRDEQKRFVKRGYLPAERAHWMPAATTFTRTPTSRDATSRRVLFVGALDVATNRDALEWYVKDIHPRLLSLEGYRLVVAGSTRGSANAGEFVRNLRRLDCCEVHTDLPDLDPIYRSCALAVIPLRHGGGVKIKTIQAVQQCLPIVTTPTGIEGSGLTHRTHAYVAETAQEFDEGVRHLLHHPEMAEKMAAEAHSYLLSHYDQEKNIARLLQPGRMMFSRDIAHGPARSAQAAAIEAQDR